MNLPKHFFIGFDGGLYRHQKGLVRPKYECTFTRPENLNQIKSTIRGGAITWPGFYPMYFVTFDGSALCFNCARKEFRQIAYNYIHKCDTGWRISGVIINYEEEDIFCCHCNKNIESAYGEEAEKACDKNPI